MQRHVTSLPIPNSYKIKLVKNGIDSVNDLKNAKPTDLIKEFGFSKTELNDLYETINLYDSIKSLSHTAYDLLKTEEQNKMHNITTLSQNFDNILGGGIPSGKIVEICGAAGVGKTQISMQICVNVQIPKIFGGLEGQAVYIDTEGSFMSKRAIEIAQATINKLETNNLDKKNLNNFTVEKIMSNIFYFRCVDHVQLTSIVNNLKNFLEKHSKVKLIVIDSLAYPFRFVDFKDSNSITMKTNILNNFMSNAYHLTTKHNLTFLITNQMTTRIVRDSTTNTTSSSLVPALGETWAHSANMRILLSWKNNLRCASITKSSYLPDATIYYKISEIGFEDTDENFLCTTNDENNVPNQFNKKRRFEN